MSVYGYVRVSTDKQELSVDAQSERIKAYCSFRSLELKSIYYDEDVSGCIPIIERESGRRLCLDVKKGDEIVSVKLDRCFRDAGDGINTIFSWQRQGVVLHLADNNAVADTSTASGFLTIAIQLVIGQYERMITGERTSQALVSAQANGKRVSRSAPYGWMEDEASEYNEENGHYEKIKINPVEQADIEAIAGFHSTGLSYSEIAEKMNEAGRKQRNGKPWARQAVWRILQKVK